MNRNSLEEVDTISVAVAGIDINNVQPLDHKRLVAFINQYLTTTVSFLNHFARACEDKLEKMHYKICKIEAQLSILESKLNSCTTTAAAATTTTSSGGETTSTLTNVQNTTTTNNNNNNSQLNTNHNNVIDS